MADFIVGSIARGSDFWFRDEFIDTLWEALKKHNVLLLAPRRIGKTTVMYRLLDEPREGYIVIHMNVEDLKTPEDFFIELIDAIHEHQPEFFRGVLVDSWDFLRGIFSRIEKAEIYKLKIELRKSETQSKWRERVDELMDRVMKSGQKVLFIIDELPDMLNAMMLHAETEYETFLHWFRTTREKSLKNNVRWLVGGSVNLISVLDRQSRIRLINDLKTEPLRPFNEEEVHEFMTKMFREKGVKFDDTVISMAIDLLGSPIPLFLQMLSDQLYRVWKRNPGQPLSGSSVRMVFERDLLGEMARDKLQHYRSRIDLHYSETEKEAACFLLNRIALSENGIALDTLFNHFRQIEDKKTHGRSKAGLHEAFHRLLLQLQSDFYIEGKTDSNYDFSSRLLKTWWRKYYGYEYGI
jgi:hypothetical protein